MSPMCSRSPSEHHLDGNKFDAEMHIVHQKEGSHGTDDLLVVGLLFLQSDEDNAFLASLGWDSVGGPQLPHKEGATMTVLGSVDLNLNTELKKGYYCYQVGTLEWC